MGVVAVAAVIVAGVCGVHYFRRRGTGMQGNREHLAVRDSLLFATVLAGVTALVCGTVAIANGASSNSTDLARAVAASQPTKPAPTNVSVQNILPKPPAQAPMQSPNPNQGLALSKQSLYNTNRGYIEAYLIGAGLEPKSFMEPQSYLILVQPTTSDYSQWIARVQDAHGCNRTVKASVVDSQFTLTDPGMFLRYKITPRGKLVGYTCKPVKGRFAMK